MLEEGGGERGEKIFANFLSEGEEGQLREKEREIGGEAEVWHGMC